jgi:hypothetical protein
LRERVTDTSAKVLDFPIRLKPEECRVIDSLLQFHGERLRSIYPGTEKFLEVLGASGEVYFDCVEDTITLDSAMCTYDAQGEEYSIPVRYFVDLTSPGKSIPDLDTFLQMQMEVWQTHITKRINLGSTPYSVSVLGAHELDSYNLSAISAVCDMQDFYACEVLSDTGECIGTSQSYTFDHSEHHVTLLDCVLAALDDAHHGGFSLEGASVDVYHNEADTSHITSIPAEYVDTLIETALASISWKYRNMHPRTAELDYFKKYLLPKVVEVTGYAG